MSLVLRGHVTITIERKHARYPYASISYENIDFTIIFILKNVVDHIGCNIRLWNTCKSNDMILICTRNVQIVCKIQKLMLIGHFCADAYYRIDMGPKLLEAPI